ncbi:hypothetical protein B9Q11_02210 [Candidatus Marsarchaeota G2 archaeon ECH_B_SAG-F08]|uniref:EamA domain-containing protein n=1 Tax=Candidatus Marsarchaeota G2 archaeon ECH_B_SAG-F08 TaxID=1978165 RepID=A0A2R6BIJ3_9ARCH|nr:MAG: hypothetical protein B9Q11_02210 [Candidatus Marsarchaeota G2 archaeon ECH_B_SAG-F08]
MKDSSAGFLFMLGVALSWGLSYPLSKIALSYISPFVLTFLRFSLGALFLLPFAKGVSAGKPQALSALLNNALFVVILNFALLYSSNPALTSVLIYTQPVFVMVLERAFFGKKNHEKAVARRSSRFFRCGTFCW